MNLLYIILHVSSFKADDAESSGSFKSLVVYLDEENEDVICPAILNQSLESFTLRIIGLINPQHQRYVQIIEEEWSNVYNFETFMIYDFSTIIRLQDLITSQTNTLRRLIKMAYHRCYIQRQVGNGHIETFYHILIAQRVINRIFDDYLKRL